MASKSGMVDLYALLEIPRNADEATIKKSYRKLVLKYHPDKNPEDREAAEEKIRAINNAYETLSNPAKRAAYQAQTAAMDTKARGVRLDTSNIRPRTSVPKAFMLCPMGFPDKFMRSVGRSLCFHSRDDVKDVSFDDFFAAARYSLWWIPHEKVNNMCRLRNAPLIATGVVNMPNSGVVGTIPFTPQIETEVMKRRAGGPPVGLILSFGLSLDVSSSDVMLSNVEDDLCSNVIAVPSPDFPGAFRFESAYFHGHFLAFDPPTHSQMMLRGMDQFSVIDFMLMDYSVCEKFRTLDEVLIPAVKAVGGDRTFVKLTVVCQDPNVHSYFQKTMDGHIWDFTDFEIYFHGHSQTWDYDPGRQLLRLRGEQEKTALSLRGARTAEDAISLLTGKGKDLTWLPVDIIPHALKVLALPATSVAVKKDSPAASGPDGRKSAQLLVLSILRGMCESGEGFSLESALSLFKTVQSHGGGGGAVPTDSAVEQALQSAERALLQLTVRLIGESKDKSLTLRFDILSQLLSMPLDWQVCGPIIAQNVQQTIAAKALEDIVPLIKRAAAARVRSVGESLATAAMMKTLGAPPVAAAYALEAMVAGGFALDGAAMTLRMILPRVSTDVVVSILVGLLERGAVGPDVEACWQGVASKTEALEALPAATLGRLAVAAAAAKAEARSKLQAVSGVAAKSLENQSGIWTPNSIARLLVALAGAIGTEATSDASEALLTRLMERLKPKLPELSLEALIAVMQGIAHAEPCRNFLEASVEASTARLKTAQPSQLLRLTQPASTLGKGSAMFRQILDYWEQFLSSERGGDDVGGDRLAKLLKILACTSPADHNVLEVLSQQLLSRLSDVSPAGLAELESVVSGGNGSHSEAFRSRQRIADAVRQAQRGERQRSRSRKR